MNSCQIQAVYPFLLLYKSIKEKKVIALSFFSQFYLYEIFFPDCTPKISFFYQNHKNLHVHTFQMMESKENRKNDTGNRGKVKMCSYMLANVKKIFEV